MRIGDLKRLSVLLAAATLSAACGGTRPSTSTTPKSTPEPASPPPLASNAAADTAPSTAPATTVAQSWLALVDAAKYDESWQSSAPLLQKAISEQDWVATASHVREPLGKVLSRQIRSAVYRTAVPGAPAGKYVIIQFDTNFEHKASATETVTPAEDEDGSWKVSGYFIK